MKAKIIAVIPLRSTVFFDKKIREMFYVPSVIDMFTSIQAQFIDGSAERLFGDIYRVMIHDIPANVRMVGGALVSLRYEALGN